MSDYLPVYYGPLKDVPARQAINGLQVQMAEYFKSIGYTPATPLPVFPPLDPLYHPVVPPTPTPTAPNGFNRNSGANTKLKAMLARGTGKIVWIDDSTGVGVGAGTGQYFTVGARPYRVPTVLSSLMTTAGKPMIDRGFVADHGMTATGSGKLSAYDSRVTLTGPNIAISGNEQFAGGGYIDTGNGAGSGALVETGDTFVITFLASNSGTATVTIDGAAPASGPASMTPGSGGGFVRYVVKAVTTGQHTVVVTGPQNNAPAFQGIRAYDSTKTAIDMVVLSAAGATTGNLAAVAGGSQNWFSRDALAFEAPDYTVIGGYFNDPNNGVPLATTISNLRSIITTAKASGDVLLLSKYPAGGVYGAGQADANTAIKNLAIEQAVDCFSEFDHYGGAFTPTIQSRLADGLVHSKAEFQAEQAGLIRDSILYGSAA